MPSIFFSPNFTLSNPLTFKRISESEPSQVLLQQKLSNYIDIVEIDLCKHVAAQSQNVFQALNNLQWFQSEIQSTMATLEELKEEVNEVNDIHVKSISNTMKLQYQRDNLEAVQEKLQLISTMKHTMPTIDILLENKDFRGALHLLSEVEGVIKKDLSGFQCLRKMPVKIREKRESILKMMSSAFIEEATTIEDFTQIIDPNEYKFKTKYHLATIIRELLTLGNLTKALVDYRELIYKKVIETIRNTILASTQPVSSSTYDSIISELDIGSFQSRIKATYAKVIQISMNVKNIHHHIQVITRLSLGLIEQKNTIDSPENNTKSESPTFPLDLQLEDYNNFIISDESLVKQFRSELPRINRESAEILESVCSAAHVHIATLFKVREEKNRHLTQEDFTLLMDNAQNFINYMEKISPRQSYALLPTLLLQSRQFLETFHSKKVLLLRAILDNENWELENSVQPEFKEIIKILLSPQMPLQPQVMTPSKLTPPTKANSSNTITFLKIVIGDVTENQREAATPHAPEAGSPGVPLSPLPAPAPPVTHKFLLVQSALMFCKLIHEYLVLSQRLSLVTTDIVTRIVELFQLFNQCTYSLVLRKGALKVGSNLTKITTKHLAIVSQSLGLHIELIPTIKTRLLAQLNQKNAGLAADFDRLQVSFTNHRQEIYHKFIEIMQSTLSACFKNFEVDFDAKRASPHFVELAKKTQILHRTLSAYLPAQDIKLIFRQIQYSYTPLMKEYIVLIDTSASKVKERIVSDVSAFCATFNQMKGVEPINETELIGLLDLNQPTARNFMDNFN
uniref:Vacuolar protein sorting-associated protein 54 n=1 Tax=Arcella intermedia TaxID=1963864 RepID=A0A6B2KY39_9EUKA